MRRAALHSSNMPPERSDWPGPQPPNRLGRAGPGQAGLAEPPARPGAAGPPVLVVRTRSAERRLGGGTVYRIGRDPKSDIVVADSRVSWRHGVLRLDGAGWIFEDAGSTNGTFIGSQRVDRVPIAADCVMHLGHPERAGAALHAPRRPGRAGGAAEGGPGSRARRAPSASGVRPGSAATRVCGRPAAAAIPADLLPSVDRRPTSRTPLPAKALRIGRDPRQRPGSARPRRVPAPRRAAQVALRAATRSSTWAATTARSSTASGRRQLLTEAGHRQHRALDVPAQGRRAAASSSTTGEVTFTAQDLVVKVGGRQGPAGPRDVPDPGEVPGRRHRPERRGQVDAARRADRDAARRHRHRAVRQPGSVPATTPSSGTASAWSRRKASCTPS